MASWTGAERPHLITSARFSRRLDANQRHTRYMITMGFRTACFLAGCFAPLPWNIVLFVSAAVLPAAAVLLANAVDKRADPPAAEEEPAPGDRAALTSQAVVRGDVEEGSGAQ